VRPGGRSAATGEPSPPVHVFTRCRALAQGRTTDGRRRMRYLLLWLIGIPLPILFIIWLLFN
jgi:hypothetical protein